ncbi:hypothetical protein BDA99DRAFT_518078 [Phascolomyces articulosus]|uniref:BTB domain-containing protein n=1 Tax=Phascolomyces articulosus TaxID=60185 RepID=A0AAD5PB03_9FUNG|nr:hypothetical protein BDA99DRAFT_518078 [Phascolomyces articulosus]
MPTTMQMQSISGIITQVRVTSGEVPPPLVGASVTVVGDKVFVFAGRLVSSRKMTNHMHVLDINSLVWTRHIPPPDSDKPPKPRYFHSASVFENSIVMFGGMGYSRVSADGLCVLDDISVFDIETMSWRRQEIKPSLFAPRPRYAHLSSITENKLIIVGGQDMNNNYLGEINILDLKSWEWVQVKNLDKHVGAYRSIAITTPPGTRLPVMLKDNISNGGPDASFDMMEQAAAAAAAAGGGMDPKDVMSGNAAAGGNHRASLVRQYGELLQSSQEPNPIYLYTNYNFADVKRELQLIFSPTSPSSTIEDCSSFMTGSVMPPGLRFPTGHTLGHHLILAGTYLSPQSHAYTIWSLNLGTLTWSRIETGTVFGSGSWNKGVLHEDTNRLLVFGHQSRNLLEDYNHRQVNFDHLATVDLEAFGVYKLPKTTCSSLAQEMGLSLLNEPAVSDFRIITRENQSISVNSAVLCQRWPYFADLMKLNREAVQGKASVDPSIQHIDEEDEDLVDDNESTIPKRDLSSQHNNNNTRTVIKSHSMVFPYPYAVVVALLQFIYTDNLLTAQQYQPHVLSQLLLLADMYNLSRLRELTAHALHQMLNMSTAPLIFETAALSHKTSLQIRALKMMIAAKKMIQQQQLRSNTPLQQRSGSAASGGLEQPSLQASPTSSLSSSGFHSSSSPAMSPQRQHFNSPPQHPLYDLRASPFDNNNNNNNSNATSPTLSAYRTRTPSITSRHTVARPSVSGFSTTRSYSPPSTPRQTPMGLPQHSMAMDSDVNSVIGVALDQPSTNNNGTTKSKEKTKKKKNFLEAFGSKFSMSSQ